MIMESGYKMKCEKCEEELEKVSNLIEGIDYYYCRKCKTHRRYLLIGKIVGCNQKI